MGEETAGHSNETVSRASGGATGARGRILAVLAAVTGLVIRREVDGYTIQVGSLLAVPARLLALFILIALSLRFLSSVVAFPYYSPVTNVEEVTLFYTSAGNFVKYGFLNSGFLPDYSTSSRALDHPYIYSHMPPGPDIFIALLLKLMPEGYRLIRLVFWAVFLVGMICYFRFTELILKEFKVTGAHYAILLISPFMMLRTFDDPLYATFPLLGFLPLLTLQAYYRTGRWWYLALTLGVGLFSAVYLDYLTLLVVSWCWGLLYFTQLLRLELRHLLAFAAVIFGGLMLHLVQNFLHMGGELFFRELWMTVSNRITGFPTQDELKAFYQANGLVHHGAAQINVKGFLTHLWLGVNFPGLVTLIAAALLVTGWVVVRDSRWESSQQTLKVVWGTGMPAFKADLMRFGALWTWLVGTILLPMIMFPAFTQEYGIHVTGLQSYFLGIGATASVLYGVKVAVRQIPPMPSVVLWQHVRNVSLALVVLALLGTAVWQLLTAQIGQFRMAVAGYRDAQLYKLEEIRRSFSGEVFMTNINPVAVGFFAKEAGHGVCELTSLPEAGDIDPGQCRVSYMRQHEYYRTVRPRYFFFFRTLFPGFSRCQPATRNTALGEGGETCYEAMHKRLANRFHRIANVGLFEVYDLAKKR